MTRKRLLIYLGILVVGLALAKALPYAGRLSIVKHFRAKKTVQDRVAKYGARVHARLQPLFAAAGVPYPPQKVVLVGLKQERVLEVYASDRIGYMRLVASYPILGASGHAGPKLQLGDNQVPEGLYQVESLNPNSSYHLALRVSYPNEYDRRRAAADGRDPKSLGGDIMIHGNKGSIGCLAMGDPASEDLFVLAAETGLERVSIIISPVDFRKTDVRREGLQLPPWTDELYRAIQGELGALPSPVAPAATTRSRAEHSVQERLAQYGTAARARLRPWFVMAGVPYPPRGVVLAGFKHERMLEVYAGDDATDHLRLITAYPIFAASGRLGPKLKYGDNQVPEGLYRITLLNPNSAYHLSLGLNYPNAFDVKQAAADGRPRNTLGGNIMIHGNAVSVGCIAVGDPAIEELFVLAAQTGLERISVVINPVDWRKQGFPVSGVRLPSWADELYRPIQAKLHTLQPERGPTPGAPASTKP